MNYLSAFLMVKDENRYLKEWVAFHTTQGFEKFYIYDNMSSTPVEDTLEKEIKEGLVDVKIWDHSGVGKHHRAMNDCLNRDDIRTVWISMTDADEFAYGEEERLVELLKRKEDQGCLAVKLKWKGFGHGGHDARPEGLVIENFLMRGNHEDWPLMGAKSRPWGKSIVRFGKVKRMGDCHTAAGVETDLIHSEFFINHYVTRSKEEFAEKSKRGGGNGEKRGMHLFNIFNKDLNKYEDRAAPRWLEDTKQKMQEMI